MSNCCCDAITEVKTWGTNITSNQLSPLASLCSGAVLLHMEMVNKQCSNGCLIQIMNQALEYIYLPHTLHGKTHATNYKHKMGIK